MRLILIILFTCTITLIYAQDRYKISEGSIEFTSDAPLEVIEASTKKLKGVIDPLGNRLAFSVKVESFQGFNSELQRQHFNENYMESSEFPKATFSGKIIEQVDFDTDGSYNIRAKGDLKIHGEKQTRIIKGQLKISKGKVFLKTEFTVPLPDHNISIPKIVNQKIATEILVTIEATLEIDEL